MGSNPIYVKMFFLRANQQPQDAVEVIEALRRWLANTTLLDNDTSGYRRSKRASFVDKV